MICSIPSSSAPTHPYPPPPSLPTPINLSPAGTEQTHESPLLDLPTGVCTFYMDTTDPRTPAVAVSCGSFVYVFKNMRPYFKFTLPLLEVMNVMGVRTCILHTYIYMYTCTCSCACMSTCTISSCTCVYTYNSSTPLSLTFGPKLRRYMDIHVV